MLDSAPYVPGSTTSQSAAASIVPHMPASRSEVLAAIRRLGSATRAEIIRATGMLQGTVNPRILELIDAGLVKCVRVDDDGTKTFAPGSQSEPRKTFRTPRPAAFERKDRAAPGLETDIMNLLSGGARLDDDAVMVALALDETRRFDVTKARGTLVRKGLIVASQYTTTTRAGRKSIAWLRVEHCDDPTKIKRYDRSSRYRAGDLIQHGAYGIGCVIDVDVDGTQISVNFPCGERELSCGMSEAA